MNRRGFLGTLAALAVAPAALLMPRRRERRTVCELDGGQTHETITLPPPDGPAQYTFKTREPGHTIVVHGQDAFGGFRSVLKEPGESLHCVPCRFDSDGKPPQWIWLNRRGRKA